MTSALAKLIAKQKGLTADVPNAESTNPKNPGTATGEADAGDKSGSDHDSDSPEPVAHEAGPAPDPKPVARLRFGIKNDSPKPAASDDRGTEAGKPIESATKLRRFGSRLPASSPQSGGNGAESPGSEPVSGELAALSESEVGSKLTASRFDDEVPADTPPRETKDLDDGQQAFIKSLDSVYSLVHEPGLLGDVISSIMMELQGAPEYRKLIQPKDIRTMIIGMRDAMGMARIKKAEKKRASPGQGKKFKAVDVDMMADLNALLASEIGD